MPARPSSFSGDTFTGSDATSSQGGYGTKTSGMLSSVTQNVDTGYKPYGALGQGSENNKAVSLDHSDDKRVMIVTIFPKINTDNSASTQTLTLGAYGWQSINFDTPTVPDEPAEISATKLVGASLLATLTLVSSSLY